MNVSYRIADWLVHGGHQYEFFKTGHKFFCTSPKGMAPNPNSLGRPISKNVSYIDQSVLNRKKVDLIIVRSVVDKKRYSSLRSVFPQNRPPGIAVVQTPNPFPVPKWVRCMVWNSEFSMKKHKSLFSGIKHFYIPHGFDPNEFDYLNLPRKKEMLAAVSVFKKRGRDLGFKEWKWVSDKLGGSALLGHGNEALEECIGSFPLPRLAIEFNSHSVFLNTTIKSAMPRTRGEAMMCGTPLVSTENYGIGKYLKHNKNCMIANTKEDMYKYCKMIIDSPTMQEDLGAAARKTAQKYFHIDTYLERWQEVFFEVLR
jgi:glycosyltransferase involved in cell wall biosynthesis